MRRLLPFLFLVFSFSLFSQSITYTNPSGAEEWAGFANQDTNMYPFSFGNGGTITFTGSVSGANAKVKFRFERLPYPDVTPDFETAEVTVSGSTPSQYSVTIPSQPSANTYSSFLLYVTTIDVPVTLSNVTVSTIGGTDVTGVKFDGSFGGASFVENNDGGGDTGGGDTGGGDTGGGDTGGGDTGGGDTGSSQSMTYTNPSGAEVWAGFANEDTSMYPFAFGNGGTITFTGSVSGSSDAKVKFRFEKNPYPDVDPSFETAEVTVSGSTPSQYSVTIPSQPSANTYSSFLLYVTTLDVPVTLSNVTVSITGGTDVTGVGFTGAFGGASFDVFVDTGDGDTGGGDNGVDTSKWAYDIGNGNWGWGNGEAQYYTKRSDNVIVENGTLKIIAKKENYGGQAYTSARLKTQGKFSFAHGRVEVRAKLPEGQGTWPAIWMLGDNVSSVSWPACGEIDIMEQRGQSSSDKNEVLGTFHWQHNGNQASYGSDTPISNASTEWHTYGLNRTSSSMQISLDGTPYHTMSTTSSMPFNNDFHFILNIAMGGTLGGSIPSNFTESTMEIDYVRVYDQNDNLIWSDEFGGESDSSGGGDNSGGGDTGGTDSGTLVLTGDNCGSMTNMSWSSYTCSNADLVLTSGQVTGTFTDAVDLSSYPKLQISTFNKTSFPFRITDVNNQSATVNITQPTTDWTDHEIDLSEFTNNNSNLDLTQVKEVKIGNFSYGGIIKNISFVGNTGGGDTGGGDTGGGDTGGGDNTGIAGTWVLASQADALGVGPNVGDISWWSIGDQGLTERACFIDDQYVFAADGSFSNVLGTDTWIEDWQGGAGCGAPVAPHDASNASTYTYDANAGTLTLTGTGAYIGLPKAINGSEITDPNAAPGSITYTATLSSDNNSMDIVIETGSGVWWQYKLVREVGSNGGDTGGGDTGGGDTGGGDTGGGDTGSSQSMTYTNPSGAEVWAGFANEDTSMYPFAFGNGGTITFTGSVSGSSDAKVKFRFEKNPYPDVDPSFETAEVTVSGSTPSQYSVTIPSQPSANTYSSFLLYVTTLDVPVTLSNVTVSTTGGTDVTGVGFTGAFGGAIVVENNDGGGDTGGGDTGGGDTGGGDSEIAIDTDKWFHQTQFPNGGSWYNNEEQAYTNSTENTYVSDGTLKIVAKKQNTQGKSYTSSRLNSKHAFKYGRVEVRAKLPAAAGTWPAIWLLGKNISEPGAYWQTQGFGTTGWPACGEIDIMEPSISKTEILGTWHWDNGNGYEMNTNLQHFPVSETTQKFHNYILEWNSNNMKIYIDNTLINQMPTVAPFHNEFYVLLNIAMGGNLGGAIASNFTEDTMEIDYVRVYDQSNNLTWFDEFGGEGNTGGGDTGSGAQNIHDDFEGNGTITTWAEDATTIDTSFSNPYAQGINTSSTVLKYEDTGGTWANVRFDAGSNFDLSSNSLFSLKIYVPSNSITGNQPNQISLKLQDGTVAQPWAQQSEIIKPIALDQWQEVTFDFANDTYVNLDGNSPAPTTRSDFNRIVLQVNSEDNSDAVVAYIDDFVYQNTLSVGNLVTKKITIAPNPTTGKINVTGDVYSIFGQKVLHNTNDLSELPSGIYFVRANGTTSKIIKK